MERQMLASCSKVELWHNTQNRPERLQKTFRPIFKSDEI